MKISISSDRNLVSAHFGRCPEFTLVDIQDNKIIKTEIISNPGHAPGAIPEYLHGKGVKIVICGGIGARATQLFNEYGIQVIAGASGEINDVLEAFIKGTLASGKSLCIPGDGRGYGIDKTVCDHSNED